MGGENQRRTVRVPKLLDVQYSANCPPIRARSQDLSETGLFLETHHPLAVGTLIELRFSLPDGREEPITTRARVCNIDPMAGLGVEFVDLSPEVRERLRMYVASVFFGVAS
jgi:uncharacterized protein (TIGR02266 family)